MRYYPCRLPNNSSGGCLNFNELPPQRGGPGLEVVVEFGLGGRGELGSLVGIVGFLLGDSGVEDAGLFVGGSEDAFGFAF